MTGEIYHVFNHGVYHTPTFTDVYEYKRAKLTFRFYRFNSPPFRLSKFLTFNKQQQEDVLMGMRKHKLVEILSYVLMPNHFHFLLKQVVDNGISKFMSNFQNSYTRYFNVRNKRVGSLFLDQFKAVRIETEEQLRHVSRYIHLNPYSAYVAKNFATLKKYPWSSLPEYLETDGENICSQELILAGFKSKRDYGKFVFNNADYQRSLAEIKPIMCE